MPPLSLIWCRSRTILIQGPIRWAELQSSTTSERKSFNFTTEYAEIELETWEIT